MTFYSTVTATTGTPPPSARRLDTGQWVSPPGGLAFGTVAEQQACGWYVVVETAAPTVTASQVAESTVTLPGGVPTRTWTVRAKTQAELDADLGQTNRTTIETQARTAYTNNRAFLAIATPTNAQVLAQTKALTRQVNALIRLVAATDLLSDPVID